MARKSTIPQTQHKEFLNLNTDASPTFSMGSTTLKRLGVVKREGTSEYYHKEIFVEPRDNVILKTYSMPFSYDKIPKK